MEDPNPPHRPSPFTARRVAMFLAGIIALAVGAIITVGIALAGAISIGVAAKIQKRKNQRLTRRGAWLASAGATIGGVALVFGIIVLSAETPQPPTAAERAEQRAKATETLPDWVKAANPNAAQQTQAADSMVASLLDNKAVMVWAGLMGTVIAAALLGTIGGSFAWSGVLLLHRSFTGDWMP